MKIEKSIRMSTGTIKAVEILDVIDYFDSNGNIGASYFCDDNIEEFNYLIKVENYSEKL